MAQAWYAKQRDLELRIGAAVRVIVTNANPVEGLVDLELDSAVEAVTSKPKNKRQSPRRGDAERRPAPSRRSGKERSKKRS